MGGPSYLPRDPHGTNAKLSSIIFRRSERRPSPIILAGQVLWAYALIARRLQSHSRRAAIGELNAGGHKGLLERDHRLVSQWLTALEPDDCIGRNAGLLGQFPDAPADGGARHLALNRKHPSEPLF
jgi:hypothetical protein